MAKKQERKELTRAKNYMIVQFTSKGYTIYEIEKRHWLFFWKWKAYNGWYIDLDLAKDYLESISNSKT